MSESNGSTPGWPDLPPTPEGTEIPTWFKLEIARGLEDLNSLRLRFRPSTEIERLETIKTVCEQLWWGRAWDQHPDTALLRRTFRMIGDTMTEWPTPADILGTLRGLAPVSQPTIWKEASSVEPEDLGEFGMLIRETMRLAPNSGERIRVLGGIVAALFSEQYFGPLGKERLIREIRETIEPFAQAEAR